VKAIAAIFALTLIGGAQQPAAPQTPPAPVTAKSVAPIDITGYWVALITEDWRWRMLTPPKGDYASLPLNNEGRRVADTWDLAKDDAGGLSCKPYGVGNIMRMPGRMHITWQDDRTLKAEFDAGTQTRLLHFGAKPANVGQPSWQGYSQAEWQVAGLAVDVDRNGIPQVGGNQQAAGGNNFLLNGAGGGGGGQGRGGRGRGRGAPPVGGSLYVATTNFREGYLRKNGVPYSEQATITEYIHRLPTHPNGDAWLHVITVVEDPRYLAQPFYTSTSFRLEPNDANFKPTPCATPAPLPVKTSR